MTAISIFDITPDMLPDRGCGTDKTASATNVGFRLVHGYVRTSRPPQRDSYGIRTSLRSRQHCTRCGISYTASNPELGDTCRDCSEVMALIESDLRKGAPA